MRYWLIDLSVDREADPVVHLRQWSKAGSDWLVRVKAGSHMRCGGTKMTLSAVARKFALFELRQLEANDNPLSGLHQVFTEQKSTSA